MTEMNEVTRRNYQDLISESPWAEGMTPEAMKAEVDRFKEETCFCKEVTTANGRALLINGEVITIVSSRPAFHVDAISRALRERSRPQSMTMGQSNLSGLAGGVMLS